MTGRSHESQNRSSHDRFTVKPAGSVIKFHRPAYLGLLVRTGRRRDCSIRCPQVCWQRRRLNFRSIPLRRMAFWMSRYDAGVAHRVLLTAQPGDERAEVLSRRAADRANPRIGFLVGMLHDDLLAGGIARQRERQCSAKSSPTPVNQGVSSARDIVRRGR